MTLSTELTIWCDVEGCSAHLVIAGANGDHDTARRRASRHGWSAERDQYNHRRRIDRCPEHRLP